MQMCAPLSSTRPCADDVARAAAGGGRHLEQRDVRSGAARLDRRREAGPAGADDGDFEALGLEPAAIV